MANEEKNMKLKAAYALNLWTVSVSQIVDYNDVNIMKQEYDNIMNNLNLEKMPKDDALLDVIKEIMDEITSYQIDAGEIKFIDREYQHQLKNAVWSAVPNVAAIFATSNPVAMGVTLATQVGIGYMNYRKNKAEYQLKYDKSKWEIQKNRMQHLNALQKQLFDTAWRLSESYEFPDEYRLTAQQITEYNKALMESNPVKRYINLEMMKGSFNAYPAFWYQLGSTANTIYRSDKYESELDIDIDIRENYKKYAIDAFERYSELNQFNLLRHDVLTSAWALEYLELLDLNSSNDPSKALELIKIAEKYSGNAFDISELCAFAYLRIGDYENAIRVFLYLVNNNYNAIINTQILSGLYIKMMRNPDQVISYKASTGYRMLRNITDPANILPIPDDSIELSDWRPEWNKEESFEEFLERQKEDEKKEKEKNEETRKKARSFYQKSILLVYNNGEDGIAEYFLGILNDNRKNIDESLPSSSRMEINEYKQNRVNIEQKNTHIILLGDSDEAKNLYKNANDERWDYDNLGMHFVSSGNKTVILLRNLKNKDIDNLVTLAREVNNKHSVKIPSNVETVTSFFNEIYNDGNNEASDVIAKIIGSIIMAPLLAVGALLQGTLNGIQTVQNIYAKKDLEFLRYSIVIYEYLERENALYPSTVVKNS